MTLIGADASPIVRKRVPPLFVLGDDAIDIRPRDRWVSRRSHASKKRVDREPPVCIQSLADRLRLVSEDEAHEPAGARQRRAVHRDRRCESAWLWRRVPSSIDPPFPSTFLVSSVSTDQRKALHHRKTIGSFNGYTHMYTRTSAGSWQGRPRRGDRTLLYKADPRWPLPASASAGCGASVVAAVVARHRSHHAHASGGLAGARPGPVGGARADGARAARHATVVVIGGVVDGAGRQTRRGAGQVAALEAGVDQRGSLGTAREVA